jgi:hypothetical protein
MLPKIHNGFKPDLKKLTQNLKEHHKHYKEPNSTKETIDFDNNKVITTNYNNGDNTFNEKVLIIPRIRYI